MVLRPTMDQENCLSIPYSPFAHMQLKPAATFNSIRWHVITFPTAWHFRQIGFHNPRSSQQRMNPLLPRTYEDQDARHRLARPKGCIMVETALKPPQRIGRGPPRRRAA